MRLKEEEAATEAARVLTQISAADNKLVAAGRFGRRPEEEKTAGLLGTGISANDASMTQINSDLWPGIYACHCHRCC